MLQHALGNFPTRSGFRRLYLFVSKDKRFDDCCNMLLSFEDRERCNMSDGTHLTFPLIWGKPLKGKIQDEGYCNKKFMTFDFLCKEEKPNQSFKKLETSRIISIWEIIHLCRYDCGKQIIHPFLD